MHINQPGRLSFTAVTIFWKEFREIFRDRRTLMSSVFGPLLITPGLLALVGVVISQQTEKAKVKSYSVGVEGGASSPFLLQMLRKEKNLTIVNVSRGEAETLIKNRRLDAVALIPEDAGLRMKAKQTVPIKVMIDAGREDSQAAEQRFESAFERIGQEALQSRLREKNLPPQFARPFAVSEQAISQGGSVGILVLARMLPYVLILSAFSGAIYAAFDQVAGEKERGTLETLLVSPASRRDIVLGKFGAVVGVCLVTSLLSITGMAVPFATHIRSYEWLAKGGVHLSPISIGVILLALLPISFLFAGLLLAVSTFARNQKEAQSYLGIMFPIVLVPAMLALLLGTDVPRIVALVPVLNASLIIRQAISGSFDPAFIVIAFVASVSYAILALFFATTLFQKESVLIKA